MHLEQEKNIRRSGYQFDRNSSIESSARRRRTLSLMLGFALATSFALQSAVPANAGQNGQEKRAENAARQDNDQQQAQRDAHHAAKDARQDARQDARIDNRQAQVQANRQAQARATADANQREAARTQFRNNVRDDRRSAQIQDNHRNDRNWNNNNNNHHRADNHSNDGWRDNRADNRSTDGWRDNRNDRSPSQAYRRPANRWDSSLSNKARYQTYRKYRNNWSDQRTYLNANLKRFNQLSALDRQQQQALDNQMRAAYLAYNNNNYNGAYNWDVYSNPQFLDYLQRSKPSLLQSLLSGIGLGGTDNYLYSSDWNDERSQLAQNMSQIHQLAASGRITSAQEQALISQLRTEFMAYQNNQYSGNPTWTQYSDPGFVDYLNNRKPSILMTVRDYLVR